MQLVAIDIGSGITKASCGRKTVTLPSLAGSYTREQFKLNDDDRHIVAFKGKRFCVGEQAAAILGPNEREDTLSDAWYQSDAYLALVYKAIAEVAPSNPERLSICTGLPVAFYASDKEKLVDRLTGNHKFSIGRKKYEIRLRRTNVHVMPQAIGLYFEAIDQFSEIADGPSGFVDIGTYTTGFVVVDGHTIREWASGGARMGMHNVIEDLDKALQERFEMKLDRAALTRYLTTRKIRVHGTQVDLTPTIEQIVHNSARILVEQLKETWGDGKELTVLVGGGGADTYFRAIQAAYPQAKKLRDADPHLAVVNGYGKYLAAKYAQKGAGKAANG